MSDTRALVEERDELRQVLDLLSTVVCLQCLVSTHTTAEHAQVAEDPSFVPPMERLTAERDEALKEIERLRGVADEYDGLRETVQENLPVYVLDDGTGDDANECETVEYAGREIKKLTIERDQALKEIERLRAELEVADGLYVRRNAAEDAEEP